MAAAAAAASGGLLSSLAYLDGNTAKSTRSLVSGTGGSIAIKVHDDAIPKPQQLVVMCPSGVQKERMMLKDMHVLSGAGVVLSAPGKKPYPNKSPKCTDCAPLFMKAYEMQKGGTTGTPPTTPWDTPYLSYSTRDPLENLKKFMWALCTVAERGECAPRCGWWCACTIFRCKMQSWDAVVHCHDDSSFLEGLSDRKFSFLYVF